MAGRCMGSWDDESLNRKRAGMTGGNDLLFSWVI